MGGLLIVLVVFGCLRGFWFCCSCGWYCLNGISLFIMFSVVCDFRIACFD